MVSPLCLCVAGRKIVRRQPLRTSACLYRNLPETTKTSNENFPKPTQNMRDVWFQFLHQDGRNIGQTFSISIGLDILVYCWTSAWTSMDRHRSIIFRPISRLCMLKVKIEEEKENMKTCSMIIHDFIYNVLKG